MTTLEPPKLTDRLLDNAGPIIRYRAAAELASHSYGDGRAWSAVDGKTDARGRAGLDRIATVYSKKHIDLWKDGENGDKWATLEELAKAGRDSSPGNPPQDSNHGLRTLRP